VDEIEKEVIVAERSSLPVSFDPLKQYLAEISRYPLLTRAEELRLAEKAYKYNDKEAARQIILSNLKLVVKIALGYYNTYLNVRDLIQEGNIGLMQAVRKYNPYKGTRFSTYASFWIRAYILKYIRDNWSLVKVGTTESQKKLFYGLEKEKKRLEAKGILPVPQLLAHNLDVTEEDVADMEKRLVMTDVSLDQPLYENGGETMMDMMQADQDIAGVELAPVALFKQQFETQHVAIESDAALHVLHHNHDQSEFANIHRKLSPAVNITFCANFAPRAWRGSQQTIHPGGRHQS